METMTERAKRIKEEFGIEEIEFKNSFHSVKKILSVDENERSVTKYVTKPTLDRSKEIVISQGIDLTDFQKNPVILYAHSYGNSMLDGGIPTLPIGKDLWIKYDGHGLLAKQQYAKHELANDIFQMHIDDMPLASSIGFIPTKIIYKKSFESKEWGNEVMRLSESYGIDVDNFKHAEVVFENSLLLEHSDVPVPANPDCLALAIKSGKISFKSQELQKVFENVMLKNEIDDLKETIKQMQSDQKVLEGMVNNFSKDMLVNSKKASVVTEEYIQKRVAEKLSVMINKKFGIL